MLELLELFLGLCGCVVGLAIVVVTMRSQEGKCHNVGTCVAASGIAAYGVVVMGLGIWLMLWAAGLT
jgi:hypothetical protein